MYSRVNVYEHHCLELWPFVITHFNNIVSTFCDWFLWTGISPCSWQVSFPHSAAILQTTVTSLKFCEIDCLHSLQNETLFQSLNYCVLSKHVCLHLRITFVLIVLVEVILYFYFRLFKSSLSQIGIFQWKWILIFMPVLSVPGIMNIETLLYSSFTFTVTLFCQS